MQRAADAIELPLEHEARALLDQALALLPSCTEPGVRNRHRDLLDRAIALAGRALTDIERTAAERTLRQHSAEPEAVVRADDHVRWTLLEAHTARAEDARYGAGQLARGSQRAPTAEDCEDGWQRVEGIVLGSEASALVAHRLATQLGRPQAHLLAQRAAVSAKKARQIVLERNRSYTFHADPHFSFGEGWYLAAAAILAGVPIQLEPDQPQTVQAKRFLNDAGLASQLVPYRPRPLANKALPDLVARAFRSDPTHAQAALRAAFLGSEDIPQAIQSRADHKLAAAPRRNKVLVWVRYGTHHPNRNTDHTELLLLSEMLLARGLVPVLVGDALRDGEPPPRSVDWTLFWKEAIFQGEDMRRAQLQLFEYMQGAHGLVGQLGVTTAGMDGPALMGLPTMYLTAEPNVRLGKWVGAVPGYQEVVRSAGYLQQIERTLDAWAHLPSARSSSLA